MDPEQLRLDFLEEMHSIIDLFFQDTRRRLSGDINDKQYNKMGLYKQVLTECNRILKDYRDQGLDKGYIIKIAHIVAPLTDVNEKTELVQIEFMLMEMVKLLTAERGMRMENNEVDDDDLEAVRMSLSDVFVKYPVSDYGVLKKVINNNVDWEDQLHVKQEVVKDIRKSFDPKQGISFPEFVHDQLEDRFTELWDDTFRRLAINDLHTERIKNASQMSSVAEALRAHILRKLID